MKLNWDWIYGCMFGIELGYDEDDEPVIVIDLLFIRFILG